MDVSIPPSIDLACPQVKVDIYKYFHKFRDRGVNKIKYGHEGIMIILITTYIYCHMISYAKVTIQSQFQV